MLKFTYKYICNLKIIHKRPTVVKGWNKLHMTLNIEIFEHLYIIAKIVFHSNIGACRIIAILMYTYLDQLQFSIAGMYVTAYLSSSLF